ncbi:hypothetical protein EVA_06160 [gut metagenome]|uniref:Uncharacterized protein n=1 Tax=gut metagenome TaxID=749906 RepID=J9GY50_9ZZZZ
MGTVRFSLSLLFFIFYSPLRLFYGLRLAPLKMFHVEHFVFSKLGMFHVEHSGWFLAHKQKYARSLQLSQGGWYHGHEINVKVKSNVVTVYRFIKNQSSCFLCHNKILLWFYRLSPSL